MTNSTIALENQTTHFKSKVLHEYVRGGRFGPYIGQTENAVIQVNRDLKKCSIPLVGKLTGSGVKGSQQLRGQEEDLDNFAYTLQPTYHRQGVLISNEENEKSEFNLFSEARPALMNWTMELKRDSMIQAFGAIEAGGTYFNYGGSEGATGSSAASAANLDTWNTNNQDRVLYGEAVANNTSGGHTASLAAITTATGKLDAEMISLMKRLAKKANPLIRPVMIKGDEPWYVYFVGSLGFRDLRTDLDTSHQNAAPRSMTDNPLWTGGDLVYDGIIIKEVPEIDIFIDGDGSGSSWDGVWGANAASADGLDNGGDGGSRVGVGFLAGAQALGFGIGRGATFARAKEDDYGHHNGVAVTMKHDIKKTFFNNKQHGVLTNFHSAAADS